jgi:hypothetical protein
MFLLLGLALAHGTDATKGKGRGWRGWSQLSLLQRLLNFITGRFQCFLPDMVDMLLLRLTAQSYQPSAPVPHFQPAPSVWPLMALLLRLLEVIRNSSSFIGE